MDEDRVELLRSVMEKKSDDELHRIIADPRKPGQGWGPEAKEAARRILSSRGSSHVPASPGGRSMDKIMAEASWGRSPPYSKFIVAAFLASISPFLAWLAGLFIGSVLATGRFFTISISDLASGNNSFCTLPGLVIGLLFLWSIVAREFIAEKANQSRVRVAIIFSIIITSVCGCLGAQLTIMVANCC